MGFGLVRAGEDAAGPGDELLEPGRGRSVEAAEGVLDDVGMPGFVICVVDVQRRNFALHTFRRPVTDHQGCSLDGLASAAAWGAMVIGVGAMP